MYQLVLKTNYNVLLWHFVDSLSEWDFFVPDITKVFFKENWNYNTIDEENISKYAKLRKPMGWGDETNLFNWAFDGFPINKQFSVLLPPIRYFEERRNRKGKSLKDYIKFKYHDVVKGKMYIENRIQKENINDIVLRLLQLFDSSTKNTRQIDAYLAFSPRKNLVQGGANGEGIYTEIPPNEYDIAYETLIHEFLHTAVFPRDYFMNISEKKLRKFYRTTVESVYPDPIACLAEEGVIHTTSDVLLFHDDPQQKIRKAKKRIDEGSTRAVSDLHLWNLIVLIIPTLEKYLSGKSDVDETRKQLDTEFQKYLIPFMTRLSDTMDKTKKSS